MIQWRQLSMNRRTVVNPFQQLFSPSQLASLEKVRDALIRDPKALDNRGEQLDIPTQPQEAA